MRRPVAALAIAVAALPAAARSRKAAPDAAPKAIVLELTAEDRARMTGRSWHEGCPIPLSDLRAVEVPYVDFEGAEKRGLIVVHERVAAKVGRVFDALHAARFPIARVSPVDDFDGDDDASMAANNTSGFNCRKVTGSTGWSRHSYGEAIDLNPLQNPYVTRTAVLPPQSAVFADRTVTHPGLITADGPVVRAFARIGWKWGGSWSRLKDWQHFSSDGR